MSASDHIDAANAMLGADRPDRATAHALLACAEQLREIGHQLDARPFRVVLDEKAMRAAGARRPSETEQLVTAAELLERVAIGDTGDARAATVRRLVAHRQMSYMDAPRIAHEALQSAAQSDDPRLSARVLQAATLLGIEVPE
jgi:hypothetical protein